MSQEEKPKKKPSDILFICAVIAVILIPIVAIVGVSLKGEKEEQPKSPISLVEAKSNLSHSSAGALKALLDVYYVNYGEYPISDEYFQQNIAENPSVYPEDAGPSLQRMRTANLENFSYSVRGDRQAYKFTYIDPLKKETVTVEGDYQNSYH